MKKIIFTILLIIAQFVLIAQKQIDYPTPAPSVGEDYKISIVDAVSDDKSCKFKLIIKNTSNDQYLTYDLSKTGFKFPELGVYYFDKSKELMIPPNSKKSKVVSVKGNDFRFPNFTVLLEGLKKGEVFESSVKYNSLPIEIGEKQEYEFANIIAIMNPPKEKKGKVSTEIEVSFSNENQLALIDMSKIIVQTTNGEKIQAEINKATDMIELRSGESHKIKVSFQKNTNPIELVWNDAIKIVDLEPILVKPIKVVQKGERMVERSSPKREKNASKERKTTATSTVSSTTSSSSLSSASDCGGIVGPNEGPIEVIITRDDYQIPCYKLSINGFPVATEYASAVRVFRNVGKLDMNFTFADGTQLRKKAQVANDWNKVIGYKLKYNKKGEIVAKTDLGALVASEAHPNNKPKTSPNETETTNTSETAKETETTDTSETPTKPTTSEKPTVNSSGCFGAHSSGGTTVRLKVTWKGAPVVGHDIQLKIGDSVVGVGTTGSNGIAEIKMGNLPSPRLDVFGCKSSADWSVKGDWVVLDEANYFHLNLEEVAAFMANLMGVSVDVIGSGWGI